MYLYYNKFKGEDMHFDFSHFGPFFVLLSLVQIIASVLIGTVYGSPLALVDSSELIFLAIGLFLSKDLIDMKYPVESFKNILMVSMRSLPVLIFFSVIYTLMYSVQGVNKILIFKLATELLIYAALYFSYGKRL